MSRKHRSGKRAQRPPDGATWIWHTLDLLDSPAWRKRSIHCRRLVDFLEREHLHHGGNENGNLLATYSQLQAEGISRKSIHGAIQEAEQRGLNAVDRGGRKGVVLNELNRFRLTYLWHRTRKDGVWFWHEPADNWRNYEAPARAIGAQMGTVTVPKRELPTVPKWELANSQAIEKAKGDVVPKWELPSTFGKGTTQQTQQIEAQRGTAYPKASAIASNLPTDDPASFTYLTGQPLKSTCELERELASQLRMWAPVNSPDLSTALKKLGHAVKAAA